MNAFQIKLNRIIFEADTPAGKLFDVLLIIAILGSVGVVMLDSMVGISLAYGELLYRIEWGFTLLFTLEYAVRIYVARQQKGYIFSFYGIIDFLSILPTYISMLLPGSQFLAVIRLFRVLRVFKILQLGRYIEESELLIKSLRANLRKILVFLITVFILVVILGSFMYVIEGVENGFTSIPMSIYWAIVTLTTVGYGDISPQTALGKWVSSLIMVLGYSIIAVPAVLATVNIQKRHHAQCPKCGENLTDQT